MSINKHGKFNKLADKILTEISEMNLSKVILRSLDFKELIERLTN